MVVLVLGLICLILWRLLKPKKVNAYIEEHKARQNNDKMYQDYLAWMEKEGHGLPIEKLKRIEEVKFEEDLKKTL